MNIHDALRYGPRVKGYKARNTAKTPRTRPGKVYPGGRAMRRALTRLAASMSFYEKAGQGGKSKKNSSAFSKPGSLKP